MNKYLNKYLLLYQRNGFIGPLCKVINIVNGKVEVIPISKEDRNKLKLVCFYDILNDKFFLTSSFEIYKVFDNVDEINLREINEITNKYNKLYCRIQKKFDSIIENLKKKQLDKISKKFNF